MNDSPGNVSNKAERRRQAFRDEAMQRQIVAERVSQIARWDLDPPKQYIRRVAWLRIIRAYITKRHADGVNRPLKFLTLPGPNATDIGYFWRKRVLQQNEKGKLNVAICDEENAEKVAANLERYGGLLCYTSRRLLRELEDPNGVLVSHFPFDVINLDFCDCLLPPKAEKGLKTVEWVIRLQRGQGFLLLLTTKPDPQATSRLLENISSNLDNEDGFRSAYVARYGRASADLCAGDTTSFNQLVTPKIIARLALDFGFKAREHFAGHYRRYNDDGSHYDMICHSLEFEPLGRAKSALKYSPQFKKVQRSEAERKIVRQLSSRVIAKANTEYSKFVATLPYRVAKDVEATLNGNGGLRERLDRESKSLDAWWERQRA